MEEKKHVGRPTNEEVANRKKKKVVKYSLITIASILLVGGIVLFLNRDNIDFSSLMGASIFKREKYVVNDFLASIPRGKESPGYSISLSELGLKEVTGCKVSNKKYASCGYDNLIGVVVEAKKSGNITLKITGKNNKGKKVTKTKRIKIGKDFKPPVCKISTSTKSVKAGSNITATVTCNESVKLSPSLNPNNNVYSNCKSYSCIFELGNGDIPGFVFTDDLVLINSIKKVNNKTYKIDLNLPKTNKYQSSKYYLILNERAFVDTSNNINITASKSSEFKITK